jgi:hypoxanthine phosphoribosyltransferase
MTSEPPHHSLTYNEVHNVIKRSAEEIAEFKPDLILAIGRDSIPISVVSNSD